MAVSFTVWYSIYYRNQHNVLLFFLLLKTKKLSDFFQAMNTFVTSLLKGCTKALCKKNLIIVGFYFRHGNSLRHWVNKVYRM